MGLLSVIVPIYNSEKYLRECLDSICNQSYSDIEIILVDDGSIDSSGRICDEYAQRDKRVVTIHKQNEGRLAARYSGLERATGKYISFLDADDWIDFDLYDYFKDKMENDIDIIIFGKQVETEKSGTSLPLFLYEEGYYDSGQIKNIIWPNMIWDKKYKQSALTHSVYDKIIKRKLWLRSYNLLENRLHINMGEDAMIFFPIMQWVKSVYISHRCFYHYRKYLLEKRYTSDNKFFEKWFDWYNYMSKNLSDIDGMEMQLDYIYLDILNLRREKWGDLVDNNKYLFPFDKVAAKSKIILYGAGKVGSTYYEQIKRINYCDKVIWVDKNYKIYNSDNIKSPEILLSSSYDYIVIAVQSKLIREEIIKEVCEIYGIDYNIIV